MGEQWVATIGMDNIPEDDVIGVEVRGRDIALYSADGEIFATDNICSHGHAKLCDGFLDGHEIECPLHQGVFDIRTGKALCAPLTEDINTYSTKVEDGKIFVLLLD